jgi:hypothetical protein
MKWINAPVEMSDFALYLSRLFLCWNTIWGAALAGRCFKSLEAWVGWTFGDQPAMVPASVAQMKSALDIYAAIRADLEIGAPVEHDPGRSRGLSRSILRDGNHE